MPIWALIFSPGSELADKSVDEVLVLGLGDVTLDNRACNIDRKTCDLVLDLVDDLVIDLSQLAKGLFRFIGELVGIHIDADEDHRDRQPLVEHIAIQQSQIRVGADMAVVVCVKAVNNVHHWIDPALVISRGQEDVHLLVVARDGRIVGHVLIEPAVIDAALLFKHGGGDIVAVLGRVRIAED